MFKALLALALVGGATLALPAVHIGRVPDPTEVARLDITVFADGTGLPKGHGRASEGRVVYEARCSGCHGDRGQGSSDYPALAGGIGTLRTGHPILSVGSYWPYAPTLWDFIHRAMPYTRPGTLSDNEVYALTAYVLKLNGLVADSTVLDQETLPRVRMPNRNGFVSTVPSLASRVWRQPQP